jgi:hypothetical protein
VCASSATSEDGLEDVFRAMWRARRSSERVEQRGEYVDEWRTTMAAAAAMMVVAWAVARATRAQA